MIGITCFVLDTCFLYSYICVIAGEGSALGVGGGMMDIEQITRKAITNTFNTLIDEGYSPSMEFEDNSLTIWTEDASAEFVVIINRKRTVFGEHVLSIQAVQGEGESYLAEMIADEMVEVVKGNADDE
jgi:hypothetical protein